MFNEKNITNALTQLMAWYAEDEPAIMEPCEIEEDSSCDIRFDDLYLHDVCMALMNQVQTVYQYEVMGNGVVGFKYRGKDLFGLRACKVFEELLSSNSSASTVNHFMELWLLEDMSFAVVENINVNMPHMGSEHYSSDYRTIKCIVEDASDLPFDPYEILEELSELSEDVYGNQAIIYAM